MPPGPNRVLRTGAPSGNGTAPASEETATKLVAGDGDAKWSKAVAVERGAAGPAVREARAPPVRPTARLSIAP